ncbi:MAG: diguanylate cyclase [Deltaproteobacteria bacterium]|nr:diguanylate cyclase [Deltaproteobacteria bacterium]
MVFILFVKNRKMKKELATAQLRAKTLELEEAKAKNARAILDATPMACSVWDKDGNLLVYNQEVSRLFGVPDGSGSYTTALFWKLGPKYQPDGLSSVDKINGAVRKALQHGFERIEFLCRTVSGDPLPVEITFTRVGQDEQCRLVLYYKDLREIKNKEIAEQKTKDDLARMSAIVESSPEAALYLSPEGKIEYMNAAASEISGYAREEIMAMDDPSTVLLDRKTKKLLRSKYMPRAIAQERFDFEAGINRKDGGQRLVLASIFSSRLHDGKTGICLVFRDLTENKRLENLSITDGLTQLNNRRSFDAKLNALWEWSVRHKSSISLLMIDIDNFKAYNDHYGHVEGDFCLQKVARSLEHSLLRATDFVARYGGEEFAILVSGVDNDGILLLADRVLQGMAELSLPHAASPVCTFVTVSIGCATMLPTVNSESEELIRRADAALYQSKQSGKNKYTVHKAQA